MKQIFYIFEEKFVIKYKLAISCNDNHLLNLNLKELVDKIIKFQYRQSR